jgi:PiT family inorganic phosphate transporter
MGMPISVSHSLIGGLIGPSLIAGGTKVIIASGLIKVLVFIVVAPVTGMILGYLLMITTMIVFRSFAPRRVDSLFKGLQLLSSAVFSLGHGSNDAQKTMGIISILLFSTGRLGAEFYVPFWVTISCYGVIALGTLTGGWRTIKTLGLALTQLKPVHGFCAETAGAVAIIGSTLAGIPVSTTHTITGAIMGVGMTKRLSAVRWGLALNIIMAWILTIPGTMIAGGLFYLLLSAVLR